MYIVYIYRGDDITAVVSLYQIYPVIAEKSLIKDITKDFLFFYYLCNFID